MKVIGEGYGTIELLPGDVVEIEILCDDGGTHDCRPPVGGCVRNETFSQRNATKAEGIEDLKDRGSADHDGLRVDEFADTRFGELSPESRARYSAEWEPRIRRDKGVDHAGAGFDSLGSDALSSGLVTREYGG
jgi:hypothetical protein